MKVEIVANGTVSFALIPENDMDRAAMKMLLKQNNEFVEITKQTQILNKASFAEGIVIQPQSRIERKEDPKVESTSGVKFEDFGGAFGTQIGDTPINE